MPKLIRGYIQNEPEYAIKGVKNTPILKFILQVGEDYWMRQPVVIFGDKATQHLDVRQGEYVELSGELQENSFRDETTIELVVGWKGNIKRFKDRPLKEMKEEDVELLDDHGVRPGLDFKLLSARRYMFPEPDYSTCPEIDTPEPTDEEYEITKAIWDSQEFPRVGFLNDTDKSL